MNLKTWKDELEKYLPETEKFLTSVLQEEAKISLESADNRPAGDIRKDLGKSDVFIFCVDDLSKNVLVIALDEEWFGLLSSIMMGVEEKTNNEITRDLLKKFSAELSVTLKKSMRKGGLKLAPGDIEILTAKQLEKKGLEGDFFHAILQVSGLADNDVRAELLIQDPQSVAAKSETDKEQSEVGDSTAEKEAAPGAAQASKAPPGPVDSSDEQDRSGRSRYDDAEAQGGSPGRAHDKVYPQKTEQAHEEQQDDDYYAGQLFGHPDNDEFESEQDEEETEMVSGKKVEFDTFDPVESPPLNGHLKGIAMLKDVQMDVTVQLGQIEMPLGQVLQLSKGSMIELDKLAGEPVDILVNGSKIAQGEVIVIDEHFGVRITNLVTTRERIARMK